MKLTRRGLRWLRVRDEGEAVAFSFGEWPRRDHGRVYGHTVAIETRGPDAVEDLDKAIAEASERLSRNMVQTMYMLSAQGINLNIGEADILHVKPTEEDSRYLISWKAIGRQRRNLIQRLIWAAGLG